MFENGLILLGMAFSLLFVLEGMLPFLSPETWKKYGFKILQLSDYKVRLLGLVSMMFGVTIMFVIHHIIIN